MKLGLRLPNTGPLAFPDVVATIADNAEKLGFYAVSVQGHVEWGDKESYHFSSGSAEAVDRAAPNDRVRCFDALTTLSFVAGRTQKLRLTSAALPLPWLQPVRLAKELTTLYEFSGGRLFPGFAIGNHVRDFEVMGVPFRERGRIFDEYLEVLWKVLDPTEPATAFEGSYLTFSPSSFQPRDRIPLWIVGRLQQGPAVDRVIRYGSGWFASGSPDAFRTAVAQLDNHLGARAERGLGRVEMGTSRWISVARTHDRAERDSEYTFRRFHESNIEMYGRSGLQPPVHPAKRAIIGTPDTVLERLIPFKEAGVNYFELRLVFHDIDDCLERMTLLAERVLPEIG